MERRRLPPTSKRQPEVEGSRWCRHRRGDHPLSRFSGKQGAHDLFFLTLRRVNFLELECLGAQLLFSRASIKGLRWLSMAGPGVQAPGCRACLCRTGIPSKLGGVRPAEDAMCLASRASHEGSSSWACGGCSISSAKQVGWW
jgi:hypothetical protein